MDAEDWLAPAGDCIFLNLTQPDDNGAPIEILEEDFNPDYTHQLFEDEAIFGYKGLEMKISFRDHDMRPTFESQFEEMWKGQGKIEAVDYKEIISEFIDLSKSPSEDKHIKRDDFSSWAPPGELIKSYQTDGQKYEIWRASLTDPLAREIFINMRILIPFFIEGGTCMDFDDPDTMVDRWSIYFLYKVRDGSARKSKASPYSFVGFSTTYRWWVFPSSPIVQKFNPTSDGVATKTKKKRSTDSSAPIPPPGDVTPLQYFQPSPNSNSPESARICLSQFVLLPPYQRKGHGKELYSTILDQVQNDVHVFELCIEDPNENFDCLRDYCDFTYLQTISEFQNLRIPSHVPVHALAPKAPVPAAHILPRKRMTQIQQQSKLTKRQFDRMTEIRLFSTLPTSRRQAYRFDGRTIASHAIKSYINSGGKQSLSKEAEYDLQYAFWALIVKNRIFLKNEDVLRQLEDTEWPDKVDGALVGVQSEYADWIEALIEKAVLPDDTLLVPPTVASGGFKSPTKKRKAGTDDGVSKEDDDDDSVLGRPVVKRVSVEPRSRN